MGCTTSSVHTSTWGRRLVLLQALVAVTQHDAKSQHHLAQRAQQLQSSLRAAEGKLRVHADAERRHKQEVWPTLHCSCQSATTPPMSLGTVRPLGADLTKLECWQATLFEVHGCCCTTMPLK